MILVSGMPYNMKQIAKVSFYGAKSEVHWIWPLPWYCLWRLIIT
jgi:hypothetical protein